MAAVELKTILCFAEDMYFFFFHWLTIPGFKSTSSSTSAHLVCFWFLLDKKKKKKNQNSCRTESRSLLKTSYVRLQAWQNIHSGVTEEPQMFAWCPKLFQLRCRNPFLVCVCVLSLDCLDSDIIAVCLWAKTIWCKTLPQVGGELELWMQWMQQL